MPDPTHEPEAVVPAAEAARFRDQARAAEQQLEALRTELDESKQTITALERRQRIDALLAGADAIDLDAARLLTEAAVAQMDEADVELAVEDLKRHKPWLFGAGPQRGALMPADADDDPHDTHTAAQQAARSGDRRDLLRYLRLRRKR